MGDKMCEAGLVESPGKKAMHMTPEDQSRVAVLTQLMLVNGFISPELHTSTAFRDEFVLTEVELMRNFLTLLGRTTFDLFRVLRLDYPTFCPQFVTRFLRKVYKAT